ncbi:MAG: hypothetical protein ABIK42_02135, partial [candidate division WOR-3 bacterium]
PDDTDVSKESLDYILKLLLEVASSPKATSIVAGAIVEGFSEQCGTTLPQHVFRVLDVFDFALRTYEWPRQEECCVSIFQALGKLLEKLAITEIKKEDVVQLIYRFIDFLPPSGSVKNKESGHAAYALLEACLEGAMVTDAKDNVINACMQCALNPARGRSPLFFGRFEEEVSIKIAEALCKTWRYLDEKTASLDLESFSNRQARIHSELKRTEVFNKYLNLFNKMVYERKFVFANGVLSILNRIIEMELPEKQTDLFYQVMGKLAEHAERFFRENTLNNWGIIIPQKLLGNMQNHMWPPEHDKIMKMFGYLLSLAKAYAPRVQQDENSPIPTLWKIAKIFRDQVKSHQSFSEVDRQEAVYVTLSLGGLAHRWYAPDPSIYQKMKEELRREAGIFPLLNSDEAIKRAKQDFPEFSSTLENYYRGLVY